MIPITAEITTRVDGQEWELTACWRLGGRLGFYQRCWRGRWSDTLRGLLADRRDWLPDAAGAGRASRSDRFYRRLAWLQRMSPWAPLLVLARFGRLLRVRVRLQLGTGDAASTAQLTAAAWILLGFTLGVVAKHRGRLAAPADLGIEPVWQKPRLVLAADCIVSSSFRDLMAILLWTLAARVLEWWRKGVERWRAIPSRVLWKRPCKASRTWST